MNRNEEMIQKILDLNDEVSEMMRARGLAPQYDRAILKSIVVTRDTLWLEDALQRWIAHHDDVALGVK